MKISFCGQHGKEGVWLHRWGNRSDFCHDGDEKSVGRNGLLPGATI